MIHGKINRCNAGPVFIYLKKHYCPQCGAELKPGWKRAVVNSESEEAKNYSFYIGGDTFLCGNVEFKTKCFVCPRCNIYIDFDDIKRAERQTKKRQE